MSHVFISYSKKNQKYARRLADHLIASGFDVWIDDRIDYGSLWEAVIQKAIEDCAAVVIIMTPESRESQWVRTECEYAAQQGKQAFPLLLAGEVFFRYVSVQYVDVRDGTLPPPAFLDELAEHVPRRQGVGEDITPSEVSDDKEASTPTVRISRPTQTLSSAPRSHKRTPYVIGAALILVALVVALNLQSDGSRIAFGQTIAGELTEDIPARSYTFTGQEGDPIRIDMMSEDFDTYLSLIDADGNEITSDDDSAGDHDSRIEAFTLPANGVYTIVAQSFEYHERSEIVTGVYTLTLERSAEIVEGGETERTSDCQSDWFFDNDYAVEGDCPASGQIEISGLMQRFGEGLMFGMESSGEQGQYIILTNEDSFYSTENAWNTDDVSLERCLVPSVDGVRRALLYVSQSESPNEVIGCPTGGVQFGTIDFQVSDSSSEYVVYIGMHQDESVYRLAAPTSTSEEGEWQRIR